PPGRSAPVPDVVGRNDGGRSPSADVATSGSCARRSLARPGNAPAVPMSGAPPAGVPVVPAGAVAPVVPAAPVPPETPAVPVPVTPVPPVTPGPPAAVPAAPPV